WWDKSIEEINLLIPVLTCSDIGKVRKYIKEYLSESSE
ncbi:MAG TPA: chloramphenicol acetyltransferase, partial [Ruminococcaceae bacterium]|nr:chloramphenicol acetyltransferase [Oscillospiraceae bacterium]